MAKKTVVEYYDDLTGARVDIDNLHTIEWSWLGVDYVAPPEQTELLLPVITKSGNGHANTAMPSACVDESVQTSWPPTTRRLHAKARDSTMSPPVTVSGSVAHAWKGWMISCA